MSVGSVRAARRFVWAVESIPPWLQCLYSPMHDAVLPGGPRLGLASFRPVQALKQVYMVDFMPPRQLA
eukprot:358763-Chlamydomonas_euryale.AAC.6